MLVRTGLTPYHRDVYSSGAEKNTRGSEVFTPDDLVQEQVSRSKAVPPVEQTIEGEILDRHRQRQYSENEVNFRIHTQSTETYSTDYNSRALAAYQSNMMLATPQYQPPYAQIDYFA
ncbi:MAG: hypothetical protein GXP14_11075 [Gammaproteobacteria bacterium]|nr:hypothetical protein [Gammaproteobacteria bacterium]